MRWEYVVKSFHYLSVADPTYWPDHLLLRQGLTASDALVNADLAWDLLRRAIRNYNPGLLRTIKNPLYRRPHVPYQDFVSGIMTCVKASDMNSCEKILSVANTMHMTPTNIRSLYVLALKGYAHAGDATKAIKVLDSMKAEKLKPG
jgi:pentatricopeptide repeat protein